MLTASCPEFTRPMYSSINFGLLPAAWMRLGEEMRVGIGAPRGRVLRESERQSSPLRNGLGENRTQENFDAGTILTNSADARRVGRCAKSVAFAPRKVYRGAKATQ